MLSFLPLFHSSAQLLLRVPPLPRIHQWSMSKPSCFVSGFYFFCRGLSSNCACSSRRRPSHMRDTELVSTPGDFSLFRQKIPRVSNPLGWGEKPETPCRHRPMRFRSMARVIRHKPAPEDAGRETYINADLAKHTTILSQNAFRSGSLNDRALLYHPMRYRIRLSYLVSGEVSD